MLYDYHLHSEFSDDSHTPMEAQIERGIALGLDEMCFTDHVDYGIKKDWTDAGEIGWRGGDGIGTPKSSLEPLTNVHYPEYFAKLYRMKCTYGDKIAIKNGLEFGIQVHTIPQYEKLLQDYGDQLDFVLCSIHQVEDKEFWTGDFMKGRTQDEYNERYYQEMLDVVKAFKGYDVLAHVDLIARYDPAGPIAFEKIQGILTEIFKIVIADGKGIELNTSSVRYGLKDSQPAEEVLRQVGLGERMDNFPAQLSGGEQQRVSIARALAKNPKLLLCDEPTGALDYNTGKQILKLLQDTCRETGRTVAVVTHNSAFCEIADRVIRVRSGKAESVEINEHPASAETLEW